MIDTDWIGCSRCSRQIVVDSPECPYCGEPVALVRGVHYTRQAEAIERLKREGKHAEAAQLLLECIAATEAEARRRNWKPAPGYYRHLAIVYRKEHRYADEVALARARAEHSRSVIRSGATGKSATAVGETAVRESCVAWLLLHTLVRRIVDNARTVPLLNPW